mmetsp:Transcript_123879/g.361767  ORF Transcript_123879/g.361767 Transcript_123879/m.361767 type:complete len:457 (+) Transcript_123879:76-1446(+)
MRTTLGLLAAGAVLVLQTAALCAAWAAAAWLLPSSKEEELLALRRQLLKENAQLHQRIAWLRDDSSWLRDDNARIEEWLQNKSTADNATHTYMAVTALVGHKQPEMYGRVREKTIWSFWYHEDSCTSSRNCTLPPHLQLCVESVRRNRGGFDYKLLHIDDAERYVSMYDLPFKWQVLSPQHQKDSLMNALLARYGGVALDISAILLRPLDDYWDEMVAKGATFRGYMYRLNGLPWRHPEGSAVWFLMSRREGIFGTAVRNQVEGMGDKVTTYRVYRQSYFALGDQTLLPILSMFNYSFPRCFEDTTVLEPLRLCPEHEGPAWFKGITGPARNDHRILLRDPRDGPQLPFACLAATFWNITNSTKGLPKGPSRYPPEHSPGGPMYKEHCSSFRQCWEDVFLRRFHETPAPGEARTLSFVKLFMHGKELEGKTRQELLSNKDSFFYNWLKLAGLDGLA